MSPINRCILGFLTALGLTLVSGAVTDAKPGVTSGTSGQRTSQSGVKLPSSVDGTVTARLVQSYGKLPLSFEANQGQVDNRVKFFSRGAGYELLLKDTEATLVFPHPSVGVKKPNGRSRATDHVMSDGKAQATEGSSLRMTVGGASTSPSITGLDELPGKTNYFIGNDPGKWRTNVPTYAKVRYGGIYPGVDLIYYGNQAGHLEYDFIVAPGADPKVITLAIQGEKDGFDKDELRASVESDGDILLHESAGDIRLQNQIRINIVVLQRVELG